MVVRLALAVPAAADVASNEAVNALVAAAAAVLVRLAMAAGTEVAAQVRLSLCLTPHLPHHKVRTQQVTVAPAGQLARVLVHVNQQRASSLTPPEFGSAPPLPIRPTPEPVRATPALAVVGESMLRR